MQKNDDDGDDNYDDYDGKTPQEQADHPTPWYDTRIEWVPHLYRVWHENRVWRLGIYTDTSMSEEYVRLANRARWPVYDTRMTRTTRRWHRPPPPPTPPEAEAWDHGIDKVSQTKQSWARTLPRHWRTSSCVFTNSFGQTLTAHWTSRWKCFW